MPELNLARQNRNTNFYKPFPAKTSYFFKTFFPYFSKNFNNLDTNLKSESDLPTFKISLKNYLKPNKIRHYSWGSKLGNKLWTQLRVGRSKLNLHKFTINLSDTDQCLCSRTESVDHFFIECFLYNEERRLLYDSMEQILPTFLTFSNKIKLNIFLHGINLHSDETDSRNSKIIYEVQKFILKTKRF